MERDDPNYDREVNRRLQIFTIESRMTALEKSQNDMTTRLSQTASKDDVKDLKASIEKIQGLPGRGVAWSFDKLIAPALTAVLVAVILMFMRVHQ